MRCWTAGLLIVLGALAGCGPAAAFQCENDMDCLRRSEQPGVCQGVGFCSFPDGGCESGQRFGEFSGAFGEKCVPAGGSGTGSGGERDTETGGESGFGTTASSGASDSAGPNTTLGGTTSPDDTASDETSTSDDPATGKQPTESELLLWIDFEDGPVDKSDYAHDVSCSSSCPGTTAGMFGTAGLFDGQHYEVAQDPTLDLSGELTLTLWVRVDGMNPLTRSTLFTQEYEAGAMNYDVSAQDLDGDSAYDLVTASDNQGPGVLDQFPGGAWRFLAIRVDEGQQQVFVDGAEVSTGSLNPVGSHLAPLHIGGTPGIGFPLLGALDDLRLYSRILSDAELAVVRAGEPLES